jgi:hypothetical protein
MNRADFLSQRKAVDPVVRKSEIRRAKPRRKLMAIDAKPGNSNFIIFPVSKEAGRLDPIAATVGH